MSSLIHATCLAIEETGILLLGAPGAGKSDLALRLIDSEGYGYGSKILRTVLVADDQVVVERKGAVLSASPPEIIKGKLEIRGLGIVDLPFRESVVLRLAIGLEESGQIERLPDLEQAGISLMGISLPHVLVDPGSSSAAARVRAAAFHVSGIK